MATCITLRELLWALYSVPDMLTMVSVAVVFFIGLVVGTQIPEGSSHLMSWAFLH